VKTTQRRITGLLLVLLALGCAPEPPPRLTVGGELPAFSLESLAGGKVESGSLAGRTVVVNFWATWCGPCLKEIPELKQLAADDRVEVVGIALDEEGLLAVKPFVEAHGMDYTILFGNQEVFQRMGGYSIPYTLVVDGEQRVVNIYRGPATRAAIEEDLKRIEQAA